MSKTVTGTRCAPCGRPAREGGHGASPRGNADAPRVARGRRGRRFRTVGAASVRRRGDYPRRSLVVRRKEVIQPQVLLRLPCYDLVPIIELTFGTFLPCGLERRL